jgi:hypothetical protein
VFDIDEIKAAAGYDPTKVGSGAFASKWADKLDPEVVELVTAFAADRVTRGFGTKGAASYKSLVLRFLATKTYSKGKSGDSQKSAVNEFFRYCDRLVEELDGFTAEDFMEDELEEDTSDGTDGMELDQS